MTNAPSLAVDARALHGSGIGRYTRELVSGLATLGGFRTIRLVGSPRELEPFIATIPLAERRTALEIIPLKGGRYSVRAQAGWAALVSRGGIADVTLFPHWDVPLTGLPPRTVVTIHDLIHLRVKGAASPARRAIARRMIHAAVHGASRLLTDSRFTRDDVLAEFAEAAGKVSVVPLAASELFRGPAAALTSVHADVRAPYLFCVANRKPHKNLVAAVEVLARLAPVHRTLQLVFAGERFPEWKRTLARATELGVRDRIVDLDDVSDDTLHALYAHAAVYLHPSTYEGFGFPVLEAMASGTPVVASSATSLPEIVGSAAELVDPWDIAAMSAAVARLLASATERERRAKEGRAQAAGFSWGRTAEATQLVLLEVALS